MSCQRKCTENKQVYVSFFSRALAKASCEIRGTGIELEFAFVLLKEARCVKKINSKTVGRRLH